VADPNKRKMVGNSILRAIIFFIIAYSICSGDVLDISWQSWQESHKSGLV